MWLVVEFGISTRLLERDRKLSLRNQLRGNLEKEGDQGKRGVWHSKAYHRYFEGYSEITVPKSNGKGTRIQRIYTGNYYRQELSKGQRIVLRILYIALFLGIAYLFVSSAILPLASNTTWYVVLPQAASIPVIFWIAIALFSYLPARRDMTIHEFRSSSLSLQKAALGSAVSLGITSITALIFMILEQSNESFGILLCVVKYLVGGSMALIINRIEGKVNYLYIPSQNSHPADTMEVK